MSLWGRQRRPLVIAHRGASAELPENTVAAFARAEALGADGVEMDVMRAGSGEVVVFHDDDLQRLAGRPERIREMTVDALREVRINGEGIPTLDEVLDAVSPSLLVNIELKSPEWHGAGYLRAVRDDGLAKAVARIVTRREMAARVLVSSFDPFQIRRFGRCEPRIATGLLYQAEMALPLRAGWLARVLRPSALHPEARLVSARLVEAAHDAGRAVNVWTVDDPREIRFLDAVGVDGIITNRPEVARAVLRSPAPARTESALG